MTATTYSTYYQYELTKLIKADIERLTTEMTTDYGPVTDYAAYRYHIGTIKGLRRALELCDEAEAILNGKE